MFEKYKKVLKTILTLLVATFVFAAALPSLNAVTRNPSPSGSGRITPNGKGLPTPTPKSSFLPLNAVYADTNVPQLLDISSFTETVDGEFVVTVALNARIRRNTISSISIGLAPKTTQGAYVDPIFQEPCTKLSNISVNTLNAFGDSTALQSRAADGDWYLEKYVLKSKTPIGTIQQPCQGQYLITSLAIVDAAKHTLNVSANLSSTIPVASATQTPSTGSSRTQTPSNTAGRYNDNAIMTSNIWNTRLDLAPCVAGSNLAPTITTSSAGRNTPTQVVTPPTIIQTNRLACSPTISIELARPLLTILPNPDGGSLNPISGVGIGSGLPIFDYAAAGSLSRDVAKLNKEISDLKKKNSKLSAELAKYKKSKPSTINPRPMNSPSAIRRNPSTTGDYPQATRTPTRRSTPSSSR